MPHHSNDILAVAQQRLGRSRRIMRFGVVLAAISAGICFGGTVSAAPPPPIVDERWNVTVNGQTIRVRADGSFRLPNIAAADQFGPTGPGSSPDSKSDDWFQVVGTATINGMTWYAYSEPFQIEQGTYSVDTLPVTPRPPTDIPESIAIEVVTSLTDNTLYFDGIGGPGSTAVRVWGTYASLDNPLDVTVADGTTYRTSNRRVVEVAKFGGQVTVTAAGIGTAFLTATNRGATAVQRFVVTTPCVDTFLVGTVQRSGGTAVEDAIVSTDGGSNAPDGTPSNGTISISVCYTPGTPFGVVVIGPLPGEKAVLSDITPVANGVTDVGVVTLGSNLIFWDVAGSGNWNLAGNWHTGTVPNSASHVFINIEDWLSTASLPESYTVSLTTSPTVTDFTLDSPRAIFTTAGGVVFTVSGEASLLSGSVDWRNGTWRRGTLTNRADFNVYGLSVFGGEVLPNGIDVVNEGPMTVAFESGVGPAILSVDRASTFTQVSSSYELKIDGELHVKRGATFSTTPEAQGIVVGTGGFFRVGDLPGPTFTLDGGILTVRNCDNPGNYGVLVDFGGSALIRGGMVDLKDNADDPMDDCGSSTNLLGRFEVAGTSASLTMEGGVIRSAGLFRVHTGARFDFKGGTILEDGDGVVVDNGIVKVWPQATAPAKLTLRNGGVQFEGNVAVGQTIVVQGVGDFGSGDALAEVYLDRGIIFTNNGTIVLDSILSPSGAKLSVGEGGGDGMMVNNGSILSVPGAGGFRTIDADFLDNYGSLILNAPTDLESALGLYRNLGDIVVNPGGGLNLKDLQSFEQLAGTIQAQPNATFVLPGDGYGDAPQFIFSGGAIEQGTIAIRDGTLTLEPGAVGRGHFTLWHQCELDGEIGPSHTVIVEGSIRGGGWAYLSTPLSTTITNRGTLIVDTPDSGYRAEIWLPSGQQLVNELGAILDINSGSGNNPLLTAALRNKGTMNIRRSVTFGNPGDTHINQPTGLWNLSNNAVVTFQGSAATPLTNNSNGIMAGTGVLSLANRTFANSGRVEPGGIQAAGTLSVTGNYLQTATGVFNIELGGTSQGQFDKLAVSQQVNLSGTLNVTLLPGYVPQAGNSFTVLTFVGTPSGDFTTVNLPTLGGGLTMQRSFSMNAMVLTVAGPLPEQAIQRDKPDRRPIRRR